MNKYMDLIVGGPIIVDTGKANQYNIVLISLI